jgi:hypothetical protein
VTNTLHKQLTTKPPTPSKRTSQISAVSVITPTSSENAAPGPKGRILHPADLIPCDLNQSFSEILILVARAPPRPLTARNARVSVPLAQPEVAQPKTLST